MEKMEAGFQGLISEITPKVQYMIWYAE